MTILLWALLTAAGVVIGYTGGLVAAAACVVATFCAGMLTMRSERTR